MQYVSLSCLHMFKTSCEMFAGHINGRAAVNDCQLASNCLVRRPLHPSASCLFLQTVQNVQTAILSNRYNSFTPGLLFGRRSLESI